MDTSADASIGNAVFTLPQLAQLIDNIKHIEPEVQLIVVRPLKLSASTGLQLYGSSLSLAPPLAQSELARNFSHTCLVAAYCDLIPY